MKLADFGFSDGINEVIAITFKESGEPNTAPVGVIVGNAESDSAVVRLYPSHTRQNVEREGVIYVNVILDPLVFVIATFEDLGVESFESLDPPVLRGALSWCRFRAELRGGFAHLKLEDGGVLRKVVRAHNRGFAALIEALVYASRYRIARSGALEEEIVKCKNIVLRCGGEAEKRAFEVLEEKLGVRF